MRNDLPNDFEEHMQLIKQNSKLPVVVGFGVSSRKIAKQITNSADGFVVGSLFVNAITQGLSIKELKNLAIAVDPRNEVSKK